MMRLASALFFASFLLTPALAQDYATSIEVMASPVRLMPNEPEEEVVGRLHYLGGLVLRSEESRFSGLSGMRFRGDELLLITDRGHFVELTPTMTDGRLTGVENVRWWNILDLEGAPVVEHFADSESLEVIGDTAYVGFERHHRIWTYDLLSDTRPLPTEFKTAEDFGPLEFNGSLEGMTQLASGALLVIEEEPSDGYADGWLFATQEGQDEGPLFVESAEPFKITDLDTLPDGDVIALERRYSPIGGVGARLRLIPAATIEPRTLLTGEEIAELGAGHTVDNMEGLATRVVDGQTQVFIVSDNNQNAFQRTLLLAFELLPE